MKFSIKKNPFFNIFWLLFFLLFFGIPFEKFGLVPIRMEGNIPLIFLLFYYLKKLFIDGHGMLAVLIGISFLLLSVLFLFIISFVILKIREKINFNKSSIIIKINEFFEKMLSLRTIYIVSFLFLISFITRLLYINDGLLHHDSVQTAIATEGTLETGRLHGITGGRYGYIILNVLAYVAPHYIFGVKSSELTINIVTILFASLSVVVLYLFVKELLNNKYIAFSSSLLFSFTPIYLSVTTYTKSHAHSIFFILLAGYFLIKLIKTNLVIHKLLFSLTLGFSLFIRATDVFVSLPLFFLIYFFPKKFFNDNEIKNKKVFTINNLLTIYIPLFFSFIMYVLFQGGYLYSGIIGNKLLDTNLSIVSDFSLALFLYIPPLALFLIVYGFFNLLKRKKNITFLLLIWFLSVLIFYLSFGRVKLRYFIPLLVPLSISMGEGLDIIRERYKILFILLLITVPVLMFLLVQPSLSFRHSYSSEKESALYISNITGNNSIIFDSGDSTVFYDYYTNKKIMGCLFADKPKEFSEKIAIINDALESNISVYMSSHCFSLAKGEDTQFDLLWEVLMKNYEWAEVGKIVKENPESVVYLNPQEHLIYKLRRKSTN